MAEASKTVQHDSVVIQDLELPDATKAAKAPTKEETPQTEKAKPNKSTQIEPFYTPAQKYTQAKKRLAELRDKRETLSGAKNKKKRMACNKKIKQMEESLEELEAMTTAEKSLEWRIRKLRAQRETLSGAKNKKKRTKVNNKLKKLEQELSDLKNGPSFGESENYTPPLPEDWLGNYTSPNPEQPIRTGPLKQYEKRLNALGAKKLCEMNSLALKNELGITNGKHRNNLLTILADLKNKIDWMPRMTEPLIVQTLEYGDGCTYPQERDELHVLYKGTLRQNPEVCFDSNMLTNNPFRFLVGCGQVIVGWDKGLMKMSLLEKARLTIAARYAYGQNSRGEIPPNSDLVFEVTLLSITRNGVRLEPGHQYRVDEAAKKKKREEEARKKEEAAKETEEQKKDDSGASPDADSTQRKADAGAAAGADDLDSLPFSYGSKKEPTLVLYLPDVPDDSPNYLTEPLISDNGKLQKEIMAECGCKISITSLLKENFDQGKITLQAGTGEEENIMKAAQRLLGVWSDFRSKRKDPYDSFRIDAACFKGGYIDKERGNCCIEIPTYF